MSAKAWSQRPVVTWKLIRIYKLPAPSQREAWIGFNTAEGIGTLHDLLTDEFMVLDKPRSRGWLGALKAQFFG